MSAKYENKSVSSNTRVWSGKYKNLHNLPHWHLEAELISCQSGHTKIMVDGHLFSLRKGDLALCPGGSIHYIESEPRSITLVIKLDTSLTKGIVGHYHLTRPVFKDKYNAANCMSEVHDEFKEKKPFFQEKIDAIIIQLLVNIFRNESVETGALNSATVIRYKELLAKINEAYEFITFQEAAAYMNLNEAYFSRFFKKISGMTFSNYLNILKVDRAIEMLRETPDIATSTLMLKCGFNTLRHFNRTFKEVTGYPPKKLPADYHLNIKTISDSQTGFDPTLPSSIQL